MHPLLIPSLLLALSLPAQGDVIRIPVGQQGAGDIATPSRGATKTQVLERFGLADEEHPAVGQPPITRWDYRTFSVYFEGNRVINSVIHHQRASSLERDAQP
ncbi:MULTISPECIES: hypothetical protein [Pseudomonadaceae]|jgi:hypothetical protein|uniref:Uncharacterized protein n=1 Tax=Pseudomonas saudiphocaensis TaxID=1499686 RepID=A0A078LJ96_9PSED|nr:MULTISPECIES: hypothetical protein [Pseudomonadaceae]MBE7928684.1 phosphodiesterase [Pseudomonas saudiphocaensis]MCF6781870.1 phosphodiesterase [Stutzerimonas stutzeri]MCF6803880.1 phosphodiesterase [Stutzerimonas stutzeri]RRV17844.1 phosphodiesterase [Pseudomonas saudiphocaensis]CDZ92828.1 hypothetical protein BN1079_00097 [Pseudomonas saudiphocaensis]